MDDHHSAPFRSIGRVASFFDVRRVRLCRRPFVSLACALEVLVIRDLVVWFVVVDEELCKYFALRRTLGSDRPSLLQPPLQPCPQGRAVGIPATVLLFSIGAFRSWAGSCLSHAAGLSKPCLPVDATGAVLSPSGGDHSPALTQAIACRIRQIQNRISR